MGTLAGRPDDAECRATGQGCTRGRRPAPQSVARRRLGSGDAKAARAVGAGCCQPIDRAVRPVQPAARMRALGPAPVAKAADATAAVLLREEGPLDATMARIGVHQRSDRARGLAETGRMTRGAIMSLTSPRGVVRRCGLNGCAPEALATDARRHSAPDPGAAASGERVRGTPVPIPVNGRDRCEEARHGRPGNSVDCGARQAGSGLVPVDLAGRSVVALSRAPRAGKWHAGRGSRRNLPDFAGAFRLMVADDW